MITRAADVRPLAKWRPGGLVLALSVLAACSNTARYGAAMPDDYRTNHPIVVTEQEQVRDIPVGLSDDRLSRVQRTAVRSFVAGYDRSASPFVFVLRPAGSANEQAAARLTGHIFELMVAEGVPVSRMSSATYQVDDPAALAPIRLSTTAMVARTGGPCGLWPKDLTYHEGNRHYANFGCAYQNNLAAQIANPADLLGPRPTSEINAERRGVAISDYQTNELVFDTQTEY